MFITALIVTIISIVLLIGQNKLNSCAINVGKNYPLTSVDFSGKREYLGSFSNDTTIWRSYIFKNVGDDSLHVLFVNPDCNCTSYHLSDTKVGKGDSIRLNIEIDMRKKQIGRFMLNTVVGLNTKHKLYNICVEGEIVNNADMFPAKHRDKVTK